MTTYILSILADGDAAELLTRAGKAFPHCPVAIGKADEPADARVPAGDAATDPGREC